MSGESRARTYGMFAIVVLGCALGGLSQTAVNAMLPEILAEFGVDVSLGQWLTTGYMLALGVTVPVVTFASRRFSDKALLAAALALFLVGSLVDLFAAGFLTLLVGRLLQAVSTGLTMPFMQTIGMTRFPAHRRGMAMGVAGIAMGFAPNIGPTIGGAMVYSLSWHSFFILLAGLSGALLVAALLLVRREPPADATARLDALSLAFSVLGFGGLLLGFSNASSFALENPLVWAPALAGAAVLVLFVLRQRKVARPLIDMGIFRSQRFVAGFVALNLLCASFMGITLIVPLYVEGACGGTSLDAGLVLLPETVAALVLNPLSGALTDRFGARPVALVAGAFLTIGAASMAFVSESTPLWLVTALQAVRSCGVSGLMPALNTWLMSDLPRGIVSDGSSFGLAARQACSSLGTALMVFAITTFTPLAASGEAGLALPYQAAFGVSALFAVATLVCIAGWIRPMHRA